MLTTSTRIAQAVRLLRAAAKDIKDCHTRGDEDWAGEPEALAAHDEHIAVAEALEQLVATDLVRQAIRDYHFALDCRVHGILAADKALKAIEDALGTHWVQGSEIAERAATGTAPWQI